MSMIFYFFNDKNIQERVAALSVEDAEREIYTGMDNLLFEKAYTHMIDIVKKFPGTLPDGGTEEITTEETVNPKELFTTKKVNLMAMIAFLNGCHEAVASEHKSEIPTDISQIIYQGELRTPQIPVVTAQLVMISADPEMQASASNNPAAKTASKKSILELLQLISVADEEALLALSGEEFTSLLQKISSCRDRTQLIHIRSSHEFKIKKQQEKEEAARKTAEQRLDVAILLEKMGVATEEELLKMDKANFNIQVKTIMPLKDRLKIIHIRSVYESNLKEQLEREEAIKIAMDREAQLDRFYATMQIKKIYKHPDGSILGCEITDPEGLL